MTIKEIFEFYDEVFIPVYAEVVARRRTKPRQIAVEIENSFSHLATYFLSSSDEDKESNIRKSLGHLQRATLDCQKILWITLLNDSVYIQDNNLMIHGSNVPIEDFYKQLKVVQDNAPKARISESQSTGVNFKKRIEEYQKSIDEFKKLDEMIDFIKVRLYLNNISSEKKIDRKNNNKTFFNTQMMGFIVGIFASIVASYIYSNFQDEENHLNTPSVCETTTTTPQNSSLSAVYK